jgi:hypothetical protein
MPKLVWLENMPSGNPGAGQKSKSKYLMEAEEPTLPIVGLPPNFLDELSCVAMRTYYT